MVHAKICIALLIFTAVPLKAAEVRACSGDPTCSPSEESASLLQTRSARSRTVLQRQAKAFTSANNSFADRQTGTANVTSSYDPATDTGFEAEYYIATFRETGCPNPKPSDAQIGWWQKQNQEKVLSDMYKICKANEESRANAGQKEECCGTPPCGHIGCVKQDAFVIDTDDDDDDWDGNSGDYYDGAYNLAQKKLQ
eukprot:gnl/TRDRNA2_/TRDRNA2_167930_c0_seq2.p1 gnl/TRDRNA2_/TRDRNA2_167930_c0~~gnl/TRDRNA2_/TRDRNA2_167930_c0_seq2.p1  ORF type:complete len:197 (-),score=33.06 gnl/TRDRNA2_/TRDRNA2_167930_c0_seq2:255-845(-)